MFWVDALPSEVDKDELLDADPDHTDQRSSNEPDQHQGSDRSRVVLELSEPIWGSGERRVRSRLGLADHPMFSTHGVECICMACIVQRQPSNVCRLVDLWVVSQRSVQRYKPGSRRKYRRGCWRTQRHHEDERSENCQRDIIVHFNQPRKADSKP